MKLASCDNCAHRKESNATTESTSPLRVLQNAACALDMAPAPGEFLCPKYAMSHAFHQEVLAMARKEFTRDVNQAMLEISVIRAEKAQGFAG